MIVLRRLASALPSIAGVIVVTFLLTRALPGGAFIRVTMSFQNARSVTLNVPVLLQADSYSTFSPAPTPSPTPAVKKNKRHPGSPAPSASATPGATASPAPSPS